MEEQQYCYYCVNKDLIIDYKIPEALNYYISHYKRVLPGRISGLCASHQREITAAIKRAREVALLPYVRP